MRILSLCLLAAALLVVVVPISGADEGAPKPRPYAIGEFVEGISGSCFDGSTLSLSDFEISARLAEKAVLEAATRLTGGKPLTLETKVETLGEANTGILVAQIGQRFGIALTTEALGELDTLDDVKSWVEEHEDAAIAIVTWSPGCSVCEEAYTAKLDESHREDTIRLIVLACDASDTPKTLLDAVTKQNTYWKIHRTN